MMMTDIPEELNRDLARPSSQNHRIYQENKIRYNKIVNPEIANGYAGHCRESG